MRLSGFSCPGQCQEQWCGGAAGEWWAPRRAARGGTGRVGAAGTLGAPRPPPRLPAAFRCTHPLLTNTTPDSLSGGGRRPCEALCLTCQGGAAHLWRRQCRAWGSLASPGRCVCLGPLHSARGPQPRPSYSRQFLSLWHTRAADTQQRRRWQECSSPVKGSLGGDTTEDQSKILQQSDEQHDTAGLQQVTAAQPPATTAQGALTRSLLTHSCSTRRRGHVRQVAALPVNTAGLPHITSQGEARRFHFIQGITSALTGCSQPGMPIAPHGGPARRTP